MKLTLLFFSLGIIAASNLQQLPTLEFLLEINLFLLLLIFIFRYCSSVSANKAIPSIKTLLILLLSFSVGMSYGVYAGYKSLDERLALNFQEKDILVRGYIAGLPQSDSRHQNFQLDVESARFLSSVDGEQNNLKFPQKMGVTLYDVANHPRELIEPGNYWQFVIKVKRPRSMVNPSGYDYEVAQMRKGVGATGYVRAGEKNIQLSNSYNSEFCLNHLIICVDHQRYQLRNWLTHKIELKNTSLLNALLIGDTSLLEKPNWNLFVQTGTLHLIAISGLHLGFFAIIGFALGWMIGRCVALFFNKMDSFLLGHCCAFIFVVTYSFLAGLNIPTLRTLIMLMVVQVAWLLKRNSPSSQSLMVALVAVLIYDPFSALDKGFWLSFIAVGLLIFCFSGRLIAQQKTGLVHRCNAYIREFIKSQWVMLIGLFLPLSLLTYQISLSAPLANLIAIPLITFFVVPCLILAAVFSYFSTDISDVFLFLADSGAGWFYRYLNWVNDSYSPINQFHFNMPMLNDSNNVAWLYVLWMALSIFLILLPQGLRQIKLGVAGLLICFCLPVISNNQLQLLVFDVGQGTSLLIRTPHHQLLYDTGPKFTESFDAGSGIVVPYLQSHGINSLDAIVVSHNDQDHSGGLVGILPSIKIEQLYLGQPDAQNALGIENYLSNVKGIDTCHQEKFWRWDEVDFKFIHYPITSSKSNNQSCVLLVTYRDQKILLAGDIEKEVERELLNVDSLKSLSILLAPHHGSHTSSSIDFVKMTRPQQIIYSAGYHNQHGHPHADVMERYQQQGSNALNTASSGSLEFNWSAEGAPVLKQYRNVQRHYWFWDDILSAN